MQSVSIKNLAKLSGLRKSLYRFITKAKDRDSYIDDLVDSQVVLDFQSIIYKGLLAQRQTLTDATIRRSIEAIAKLSQATIERVRQVIDEEYGSFDLFVTESQITNFYVNIYSLSGNHVLDKINVSGVFNLKNPEVIEKLNDRTNFLIQSVDDTTKNQLARMISLGVEEGQSWSEIASEINQTFPDIAAYRSQLIARMETANAVNLAELDFYDRNGILERRWVLASSHTGTDICDDNASAGAVRTSRSFPSGDDAPPAHVNCMCTQNAVIPEDFIENGPKWMGE